MNAADMELLHPEDAASWEEFQAHIVATKRQRYGRYAPKTKLAVLVLGLLCGAGALVSLVVTVIAATHDHWTAAGIAFACAVVLDALFMWAYDLVKWPPFAGSKRYKELRVLRKAWQARADRGELQSATPAGPKLRRDDDSQTRAPWT